MEVTRLFSSPPLFKSMSYQLNLLPMEEEYLSPEIKTGIEPNQHFDDLTRLSEVEIRYNPKVRPKDRPRVTMAMEAYKLIRPFFDGCLHHHEEAWVMLLDRNLKVLGVARISVGNQEHTIIDPRTVLQLMLKTNSTSLIIFYNHPSQNLAFSPEDLRVTRNIMEACRLLNMNCLDHVIVGEDSYSSYSEEGY